MLDISIQIGSSILKPHSFSFASGLSIINIFRGSSKIGVTFDSLKLKCSECNTPVAELYGGSLIIKNKHHSQRHSTAISINDLLELSQ